MSEVIRHSINPEVRVENARRGIISYVASDESVDSDREVIRASGWRFGSSFKKNAPFLNSHKRNSIEDQLGKVIDFAVKGGKLINTVQWAIDVPENKLAQLGFKMTEAGYLKAVSVGFMPVRFVTKHDSNRSEFQKQLRELNLSESSGVWRIFLEQEQRELSAVVIPSNANALSIEVMRAYKGGVINQEELDYVFGEPRKTSISFSDRESKQQTGDDMTIRATRQEEMLAAFDRLSKGTKAAAEHLTKLKNNGGTMRELGVALWQFKRALHLEEKVSFGDPLAELRQDEEAKALVQAWVKQAINLPLTDGEKAVVKAGLDISNSPGSLMGNAEKVSELFYSLAFQNGAWAALGVQEIVSHTHRYPRMDVDPDAGWILTDGDELPEDENMTGAGLSKEAKLIGVLLPISLQLAQDFAYPLAEFVLKAFTRAFNKRLSTSAFVGDGTANRTHGGQSGIFTNGTPSVAGAGQTSVAALTDDAFCDCMLSVDAEALDEGRRPMWFAHQTQMLRMMKIRSGGQPLLTTPVEQPGRGIVSIKGFPLVTSGVCPSTDGASASVAAFGDADAQTVGVLKQFTIEASDDAKWTRLQRVFRGVARARTETIKSTRFAVLKLAAV